jgi:hypothetical protein
LFPRLADSSGVRFGSHVQDQIDVSWHLNSFGVDLVKVGEQPSATHLERRHERQSGCNRYLLGCLGQSAVGRFYQLGVACDYDGIFDTSAGGCAFSRVRLPTTNTPAS